jgi:hypothetical protein
VPPGPVSLSNSILHLQQLKVDLDVVQEVVVPQVAAVVLATAATPSGLEY